MNYSCGDTLERWPFPSDSGMLTVFTFSLLFFVILFSSNSRIIVAFQFEFQIFYHLLFFCLWNLCLLCRRSLLTQSPLDALPLVDSVSSRATESGSHSSERILSTLQTPQNDTQSLIPFRGGYSVACWVDSKKNNLLTMRENGSSTQIETSSRLESRKRKLSFNNACSTPARNLRSNNNVHSEQSPKDMNPGIRSRQVYNDLYCDDEFYQSLDLDAVEAQATELLRYTSRLRIGETPAAVIDVPSGINQDSHVDQFSYPSFDLGF